MSGNARATWEDLRRELRKAFAAPAKPTAPAPRLVAKPAPKAPAPKPAPSLDGLAADATAAYFAQFRNRSPADQKRYQDAVAKAKALNNRK
jgi:hypothetical protein